LTRLALALAFLTAALGIAFGTFTADGADSYGYVSQADLWLHRTLIIDEPLAGEAPWRNANWTLTAFGYRPGDRRGTIVPTYSAGPDNAVILSNQHSGSLRYYAGRITMRFEWLDPDMYRSGARVFRAAERPGVCRCGPLGARDLQIALRICRRPVVARPSAASPGVPSTGYGAQP